MSASSCVSAPALVAAPDSSLSSSASASEALLHGSEALTLRRGFLASKEFAELQKHAISEQAPNRYLMEIEKLVPLMASISVGPEGRVFLSLPQVCEVQKKKEMLRELRVLSFF